MGGINFSWLAVWILSTDWLNRKLEVCDFYQALRCSCRAWGRGVLEAWTGRPLSSATTGLPALRLVSRQSL